MLEDKDYVMRMIHESIRMLIRLIFNRDIDKNEDMGISLETAELYQKLITMADAGEINEAENLLLDGLRENDKTCFETALLFYEKLSGKDDEFLAEHEFPAGDCGRCEICCKFLRVWESAGSIYRGYFCR